MELAKIVTIVAPIAIHASGLSVVELLADQRQMTESMLPDVASLIFVTATSMIATEWLQKNPIRLTGTDGMKSFVVAMIAILSNIAVCDLSLRLLWIPIQYFLRNLKDQKIMALVISRMFFFLRFFNFTREILTLWIKASKTDAGFVFARNLVAAGYLLGTLWALNYLPKVKRLRAIRNKR
ncbi:uncharacterized protein LOC135703214 [Ochlerotatus camptorhynchus]|uniref:uncharacterized protein LOC135703214 n=1 Tax=Ochlerotatus camptorhynchus TaxID=644619 RepID=UPI0031CFFE35